MLKLGHSLIDKIHAHGARDYPNECCGALLGRDEGADRVVVDLMPLANQRNDSPRNRFSIAPLDVQMAENEAKEKGCNLIGWYHSHPDAPARPSEFDREHAWPWYSYVIFQVEKGEPREMRSWRLEEDGGQYAEEAIEYIASA
ncbi:MAG TPA: M67 family metallopeptidase [Candidatus Acidoferrales bacterium]|nr:M67 family metallopeptidase [Candidatus Acidoferrales bacterium]